MSKLKALLMVVICLLVGGSMVVYADDPIQQASKPTSKLTIHVLQQEDKKELGMDGNGQPNQQVPSTAYALPGVTVTIQKVRYNDHNLEDYTVSGSPIVKESGADGLCIFDNVPNGRYIVKYTNLPDNVRTQVKDHFVDLPARNLTGEGWNYDVHVYPKNETVYGAVILTKNVGDDGVTPIPGAEFRCFIKGKDGRYTTEYMDENGVKELLTTDNYGQCSIDELPAGEYALVEQSCPAAYGIDTTPVAFTIDATGRVTNQNAEKKWKEVSGTVEKILHTNYKIPELHKGVKSVVNQHSGYDIDRVSTWVVNPVIPQDIQRYSKFIVSDDIDGMDTRLKFSGLETLNVVISDTDLSNVKFEYDKLSSYTTLTKDTDYKATYNTGTQTWEVTFIDTAKGFNKGQTLLKNKFVYIVFGCNFDTDEHTADDIMGRAIKNKAKLTYNNSMMPEDRYLESETPEIHTGGIAFYKYTEDVSHPLQGAVFKVSSSEENALKGVYLKKNNGIDDWTATSDVAGIVRFDGLAYGVDGTTAESGLTEYWIVEVKAPDGYLLYGQPIKFTVNATSDNYTSRPATTVENVHVTYLPTTGGTGLRPFVIVGGCFFGCMVMLALLYIVVVHVKHRKLVE